MIIRSKGKIIELSEKGSLIHCPALPHKDVTGVEVIFYDGRSITIEQRKKAYALIRDIAEWSGYLPEEVKEILKWYYRSLCGAKEFSLSDCSIDIARGFIDFLIEFCLMNDVPCRDSLPEYAEDIRRYLYLCLYHKKCCICGKKTELHHVDHVGMGYDRREIVHIGKKAEALCTSHHKECHDMGQADFDKLYHICGIEIDAVIAERYRLRRSKKQKVKSKKKGKK